MYSYSLVKWLTLVQNYLTSKISIVVSCCITPVAAKSYHSLST